MNTDDEKISSLYQASTKTGPPENLDESILAAARDAVAKPVSAKGPFSGSWPALASIAAVVVITVILVPVLNKEQQPTMPSGLESSPAIEAEEAAADTYRAIESLKKERQQPTSATAPVLLQEEHFSKDLAAPTSGTVSSDAMSGAYRKTMSSNDGEQQQPELKQLQTDNTGAQAADSAPFAIYTPEMWEQKIVQLIEQGDTTAAKTEAERLKQRYPEHTIKQSVLEKLETTHE